MGSIEKDGASLSPSICVPASPHMRHPGQPLGQIQHLMRQCLLDAHDVVKPNNLGNFIAAFHPSQGIAGVVVTDVERRKHPFALPQLAMCRVGCTKCHACT